MQFGRKVAHYRMHAGQENRRQQHQQYACQCGGQAGKCIGKRTCQLCLFGWKLGWHKAVYSCSRNLRLKARFWVSSAKITRVAPATSIHSNR